MTDYERARRAMVDSQLRTANVTDRRILGVMGRIPRERFVHETRRDVAYIDEPQSLLTGSPRKMPAPAAFARLLQLGAPNSEDRVLDVGCGTGYSTAVLASLAHSVTGVEDDEDLVVLANAHLSELGIGNADVVRSSLDGGPEGEFDLVIVEGAVDAPPRALFPRVADGGRLVAVIRQGATAVTHVYVRIGNDITGRTEFNLNLPALAPPQREESFVF